MAFFHKKDGVIILALLGLGLALLLAVSQWAPAPGRVEIRLDGAVVGTYSLSRDQVIVLPQLPAVTLEIRGGKAAFTRSDCPDRVCIHTGWIGRSGQYAACLPNRVSIWITGGSEMDAVIG